MAKLNALLLSMLLLCALLLVTSQHQARKLFIDLERAQAQARRSEVQWKELQLQQTQLAKHSLIDAAARRELKMQPVTPDRTLYMSPAGTPVAVPTAGPNAAAAGGPAAKATR